MFRTHLTSKQYKRLAPLYANALNSMNATMEALSAFADAVESKPRLSRDTEARDARSLVNILEVFYDLFQGSAPLWLMNDLFDHSPYDDAELDALMLKRKNNVAANA